MTQNRDRIAPGRVMFVSSIVRYGGGERWMCDAAAGLRDRGHTVNIVARPGSDLVERARTRGVDAVEVEMRGDFDPAAVFNLMRHMGRLAPHVVCVNLDREVRLCAVAAALARRVYGRRLGGLRLIPRRGSEFPLKNKYRYRLVYTRHVDCVITNSIATRTTMMSKTPWFPPDKAVVIYNGIDTGTYDGLKPRRNELRAALRHEVRARPDAPVVTLVGELNERKGHRHIIGAARTVLKHLPDVHFVFVGEGAGRDDVERRIAETGLDRRIQLLGFRRDIPEILTASDLLVLPSRVEGFGYVLVEAMAAELPVVASRASSIPEIVEDERTGLLHGAGDEEMIASHITRLLDDPDLRRTMGSAGYARVRGEFDVSRMIDRLESLFFAHNSSA